MSEKRWIASADPAEMLRLLRKRARVSGRKLRLFACECLRDESCWEFRDAVEVVARFADGRAGTEELAAAAAAISSVEEEFSPSTAAVAACSLEPWEAAIGASQGMISFKGYQFEAFLLRPHIEETGSDDGLYGTREQCEAKIRTTHAALLRDLFGEQYRLPGFAPGWLTPTVTALAAAIYADRAWDRMPMLADALEEAGCTDPRVLDHCRAYPVHARGCWVVDAILGKS